MRAQFTVLSTLFASVAIIAWTPPAPTQPNGTLPVTAKPGEWRYLNADPLSTRYSLLDQITKDNFKDLKIVWRWKPAIGPAPSSLGGTAQSNGDPTLAIYKSEATPIMANGVLYESAGGQRVVAAIDAATGKQLWLWNGMDESGRDRKAPRRNAGVFRVRACVAIAAIAAISSGAFAAEPVTKDEAVAMVKKASRPSGPREPTRLMPTSTIGQPGSSTASSISWCAAPMGRYWRTAPTKRASEPTRSTAGTLTARPSSKNAWSSPSKIRPSGTPISG
jgi:hypothetical protein